MNKFEVRNMDLYYGSFHALKNINIDIPEKEITAFIGPSGCGKSTFLKSLNRMNDLVPGVKITGEVDFHGQNLYDSKVDPTWLRKRIGMVFQEPEHQFVASSVRDEAAVGPKSMGKTDEEAYSIADRLLERLNLSRFAKANPFTLSGGEKRRLSVASMLAAAPKVLVMDEPTFGQDFTTWTSMVQLIAGARDQGCAVIMITHDEPLIEALGARRILVREGE